MRKNGLNRVRGRMKVNGVGDIGRPKESTKTKWGWGDLVTGRVKREMGWDGGGWNE